MRRHLSGERFEKVFIRMPIAAPTVTLLTARGAYTDMIVEGQRHTGPDLPVVSVLGGFAFADAPEAGISILAYGSGAKPREVAQEARGVRLGRARSLQGCSRRSTSPSRARAAAGGKGAAPPCAWPTSPTIPAVAGAATPPTWWRGC